MKDSSSEIVPIVSEGLMSTPNASQSASKAAVFRKLCDDFSLCDEVYDLLITSPFESLDDLRFYSVKEEEIASFIEPAAISSETQTRLMAARMRRCWTSLRVQGADRDGRPSAPSAAPDLDDLLEEKQPREVKVNFWRRYRIRFPADVHPFDSVISRSFREVELKLLTVYDCWKV